MSFGEFKWRPSPETDLSQVLGAAVAGKDIKKITAHLFSGVLRDAIILQGREPQMRREDADFSIFTILFPSWSLRVQGQGFRPARHSPMYWLWSADSEFMFTLVSVDFIGSLWDNTLEERQKFYMRSQFFPLCVSTLQGYVIWWEKSRHLEGILFISHSYWLLWWFWHLNFEEFAFYSLQCYFRKEDACFISFFFFFPPTQILKIVLISNDTRITFVLNLNLGNSLMYKLNSSDFILGFANFLGLFF